ncbi:hypothetical protein, conserved [Eimeria brunetti]|uniref:Uncharacterized protein n=1 Tax=Eimeria brunetti TaxID=51314 RepID=U6LZF1_9EIME|nr:hypothetical protein, conserved [Eimeria brunetti]
MIKLKKKKSGKLPAGASGAACTPESATPTKRPGGSISSDSSPGKKPKLSSSPVSSSSSSSSKKDSAKSSTSPPLTPIELNGGYVDSEGLLRAITALCRHIAKQHKEEEEKNLLGSSGGPTVSLMFSLQQIPPGQRIYPHLIQLPHSPHDPSGEACLIVKDPQRKWKDAVAAAAAALPFVKKVISYRKLNKKFPQFADKRQLAASFDFFVVDTTVKEKVYNTLGRIFHSANR